MNNQAPTIFFDVLVNGQVAWAEYSDSDREIWSAHRCVEGPIIPNRRGILLGRRGDEARASPFQSVLFVPVFAAPAPFHVASALIRLSPRQTFDRAVRRHDIAEAVLLDTRRPR
jgi:hypothetical protein